ncbi:septum site-determining protein MinC [Prevotella dentalis DSM 3688]|uniref:Septum site-determining protein MinC n=1 Tax=Prevotella dentalis (strain ATCC 49559 / DSM 3688 / JCM 13448 / NCTC 12043 / ES 2772) TaxID=908937 RepID=F9D6X2_PREDD|nr:septum site-determining protein MinC [Prevotella dentalis DSM 3688]
MKGEVNLYKTKKRCLNFSYKKRIFLNFSPPKNHKTPLKTHKKQLVF